MLDYILIHGAPVFAAVVISWIVVLTLAWWVIREVRARRPRIENSSPAAETTPNMSRRRLLSLTIPAVAAPATVGSVGALGASAAFIVKREAVRIRGLPHALDGFRIGLITDSHIGCISPDRLQQAVECLNEADVHMQVMGGDLIDDLTLLEPTFAALERCNAPYGLFAVLGNHEKVFAGRHLPAILAAYESRKAAGRIRLLVDSHVSIEHRGVPLHIVGVDFPLRLGRLHEERDEERVLMRASAEQAFQGIDPEGMVLCLSHHPDFFPFAAERGARLTLAGHSHGGQIGFLGRPLLHTYDYMLGRYQLRDAHLYVSSGLGHWFPLRLGMPTDVTILTLRG